MHSVSRLFLPALVLVGLVRTIDAQQDAAPAPPPVAPPAPARVATVSGSALTGISPLWLSSLDVRAQVRVGRFITVDGVLGAGVRTEDFGGDNQRGVGRSGYQVGVRAWPQGRALQGWSVGLLHGRYRHEVIDLIFFEDEAIVTLPRTTLEVGHQWLLRASRRLTAFAVGSLARNGSPPRGSSLAVPGFELQVGAGVGVAF